MEMSFEETKKTIFEFFDPLNTLNYEFYEGLNTQGVKEFFFSESKNLEKQMKEDFCIRKSLVNEDWFYNILGEFLNRTQNIIYENKHPESFRQFQKQITVFLNNWVNILHPELMKLKNFIQEKINFLSGQVDMWYSLYDLINMANQQTKNLEKWNSFRPTGFNVARHMLDSLKDE